MSALALLAATLTTRSEQLLTSAPFEALARAGERRCPAAHIRRITPADLLEAEDRFVARLPRVRRIAVEHAMPRLRDGEPARCATSEGGAACPATAQLKAIRRAQLLHGLTRAICARGIVYDR